MLKSESISKDNHKFAELRKKEHREIIYNLATAP